MSYNTHVATLAINPRFVIIRVSYCFVVWHACMHACMHTHVHIYIPHTHTYQPASLKEHIGMSQQAWLATGRERFN